MDVYIQKYFPGKYFDENAEVAAAGIVNENLLKALKQNDFFEKPFPKTTGPELFNFSYLENAQQKSGTANISHPDCMATLNRFSADTIVDGVKRSFSGNQSFIIYASGGGMHNPLLMQNISRQLPGIVIKTTADLEINPDAKEAVLFAILANECVNGGSYKFNSDKAGIPSVTMGKLSFPD
jgi:anhydro-N-acetylmuramic acid kinase